MSHVMYQTKSVTNYSDSDKLTPRSPFCPFRAIISKMWVPLNIKVYIFLNISSFRFERDATTLYSVKKKFLRGVSNDVTITLWAVKNMPTIFTGAWAPKFKLIHLAS